MAQKLKNMTLLRKEIDTSQEFLKLPLQEVPFVVFDTETSLKTHPGQPAFYDMVEIGCLAFNLKGQHINSFHSLVRPYYPFNRTSCKAMHITESALETAPAFPEIAGSVANIFTNNVILGQNTQFDIKTVRQATGLYGGMGSVDANLKTRLLSKLDSQYLDTKKIFTQLFPKEKLKGLDVIAQKIGVNPERTKHSALEDARLTRDVFSKLTELSQSRGVVNLGHLFEFQEGDFGKSKQIMLF